MSKKKVNSKSFPDEYKKSSIKMFSLKKDSIKIGNACVVKLVNLVQNT